MSTRFGRNKRKLTNVKSSRKLRGMPSLIHHDRYKPLKGYLTISQVAKILGKSRQATRLFIIRRGLPITKIGEFIIIHKSLLSKLK